MRFDPHRRTPLTRHDLDRFPGESLFDRVGRALCEVECMPRKELYESWEVARRVRRRVRGGRVVDLACGHGLLASLMLLLDDSSPTALALDVKLPPSAHDVVACLAARWPRIAGRVGLIEQSLESVSLAAGDVVVSAHACGALTDTVLARAIDAHATVAVLPCCQARDTSDTGGLTGWVDPGLAIDLVRAATLRAAGYVVVTQQIPAAITPKNRLLMGWVRP
jgi:hypothetical protein